MTRLLVTLTFAALVAVAACAHAGQSADEGAAKPATYVEVENTLPEGFRLYVSDGSQRLPVGSVNPLTTTRLRVPPSMIFPAIALEFIAVPTSGTNASISERLAVSPGDVIHLRLAR